MMIRPSPNSRSMPTSEKRDTGPSWSNAASKPSHFASMNFQLNSAYQVEFSCILRGHYNRSTTTSPRLPRSRHGRRSSACLVADQVAPLRAISTSSEASGRGEATRPVVRANTAGPHGLRAAALPSGDQDTARYLDRRRQQGEAELHMRCGVTLAYLAMIGASS